MLVNDTKVYNVSWLIQEPEQERRILDFLQGMVYAHCAIDPEGWFSVSSLLGEDNRNWNDIPLQILHDKYINDGESYEKAFDSARKDAGKLLKKVIRNEPNRRFENDTGYFNQYRWIR